MSVVFNEVTEAQLLPRLIRLGPNLYGAAFTLMKLIPARHILTQAVARGRIGPRTVIVETTSGTFGLGLAMQAALLNRKLILVSDPVMDDTLRRRLADLGAEVEICTEPAPNGGYQEARLQRLAQIRAVHPNTFCPEQYRNPDNPASYAIVADQLTTALGPVGCLVGPVGSGGSMCGTTSALRAGGHPTRSIAVDTPNSVLFGQPDGTRQLRGLGNSLIPANLDHTTFDEVHWCTAAEAYAGTRELHRRTALFQGPTSGAAYLIARWWATRNPRQRCVVMLPDEGHRYANTVYDDAWLARHGHDLEQVPNAPLHIDDVTAPIHRWSRHTWARRSNVQIAAPPGAQRPASAAVGAP